MRLLPVRPDHGRRRPAGAQRQPHRSRDRPGHGRQSLSLRHVLAHPPGRPSRRRARAVPGLREASMTNMTISRRGFIVTTAIAGGGMALGFHLPARAEATALRVIDTPNGVEVNAWLTIDADGIVTVRTPHTEQGQGAF